MNEALKLNLPEEIVIKISGGGGQGSITVDSELSTTSTNPPQNKVVTAAIYDLSVDVQKCVSPSDMPMYLAPYATNERVDEVEGIAKGRATGYVFDTVDDLDMWLTDSANTDKLVLGDNFYIRALDVPDYWWDGTEKQQLETQKVNLSEYYTKSETDSKLGQKANVVSVRTQNASSAFEIADNSENRVDGAVTNLGMAIYTYNNTNKFESSLFFVTGENPTPHIYIENFSDNEWILKFVGDDCNSDYAFTPISNTAYEITFKYIGTDLDGRHIILARVGAC